MIYVMFNIVKKIYFLSKQIKFCILVLTKTK